MARLLKEDDLYQEAIQHTLEHYLASWQDVLEDLAVLAVRQFGVTTPATAKPRRAYMHYEGLRRIVEQRREVRRLMARTRDPQLLTIQTNHHDALDRKYRSTRTKAIRKVEADYAHRLYHGDIQARGQLFRDALVRVPPRRNTILCPEAAANEMRRLWGSPETAAWMKQHCPPPC